MREKVISCCGVVCSDCEYYPDSCQGCPSIEGKPFWLEYTGAQVCDIYQCCMNEKQFGHCGHCSQLPCHLYEGNDPTKTEEENEEDFRKQMVQLKKMDVSI